MPLSYEKYPHYVNTIRMDAFYTQGWITRTRQNPISYALFLINHHCLFDIDFPTIASTSSQPAKIAGCEDGMRSSWANLPIMKSPKTLLAQLSTCSDSWQDNCADDFC